MPRRCNGSRLFVWCMVDFPGTAPCPYSAWQLEVEARAGAANAGDTDPAAVCFDDALAHVQSQAAAVMCVSGRAALVLVEDPVLIGVADSRTEIAHGDARDLRRDVEPHGHPARARRVIERVLHQICHHAPD